MTTGRVAGGSTGPLRWSFRDRRDGFALVRGLFPGLGDSCGQAVASTRDGEGLEIYGDSAYGSGEARAAYRDAGHVTIIKPKPLRPAVDGSPSMTSPSTSSRAPSPAPPGRSAR